MNAALPSIVVLDGYTLNPGDLDWGGLEALGHCAVYERTSPRSLLERAANASIAITNKVVLCEDTLRSLSALKYVGIAATGTNVIDLEVAKKLGIVVTNVPNYGAASVAQTVMAHLLNLTQHVAEHAAAVRANRWTESPDFCFWDFPLVELAGRKIGIVGLGDIGLETAKLAHAFGMQVLATVQTPRDLPEFVSLVDLDTLFQQSDVVSLHCPLTEETLEMVNQQRLQQMKPSALLINTARGPLVDEQALADALNAGEIAGAGLDVLTVEPPTAGNPLFTAKNCYITPHLAWATKESRSRLMDILVNNVAAFLAGSPVNVVNS